MPDALEMLRTAIASKRNYHTVTAGDLEVIARALEAERRENDERGAKIRIGILFARHPDTSDKEKHLRKALALLDGGAE